MAHSAYLRCTELRRQFVNFLTVYDVASGVQAYCEDESPYDMLKALHRAGQIRQLSVAQAPKMAMTIAENTPAYWYFDCRLVHMALDAALHNASRFARQQVDLGVHAEQGFLVFTIDDDGPGLGASDPSSSSTGLGTDLCRAVARAHHCGDRVGRVCLSNRPQGGARFELWLP
jgi:signal transduction histidine kinase